MSITFDHLVNADKHLLRVDGREIGLAERWYAGEGRFRWTLLPTNHPHFRWVREFGSKAALIEHIENRLHITRR